MCSSWWPAILQTIEKTSNENHVWKLLFLFPLLPVVLSLRDAPKKHSEWTKMGGGGTSSRLGGRRPLPHRSDGTGYQNKKWYLSGKFCKLTAKNNKAILWTGAAKSNLNPKKVGCFAKLEKTVLTPIWIKLDPLVIASLAARRILHISAVIPHFGCKYNNVIPNGKPKIWFIQRSTAKQEVNYCIS